MKRFIKNSKYIVAAILMIIGLSSFSNQAHAGYVYTSGDVPYTVTTNLYLAPVANAGIDRPITLPTNSVTIPAGGATATDADSPTPTVAWTQVGATPSTATITNQTTLQPTFSNLIQGTYTFRLTATDSGGLTGTDDMTVTVSAAANLAPTANAGPDQSITLPSGLSLSGSGTDPENGPLTYLWTGTGGTITSPTSANTSVTGLSAGSYTFTLTVTDNGGLSASDSMVTTVSSAPPATGSLFTTSNTCTIALNQSTCTVTGLYWNTSGTSDPKVIDTNVNLIKSTSANNPISSPLQVWAAYPSTTFELRDGSSVINSPGPGSVTITTNCGANTWNGSICVAPVVNAVCASSHFNCNVGTYPGGGTGGASGPWAWSCTGSGGGSSASCSETAVTQCNNTADDDGDGLVDANDPGCHVGNVMSGAYDPTDNTERNNPKIIEKEL